MSDRHEVMVLSDGAVWTLRLRRADAGPIDLREKYFSEPDAVHAAYEFIRARKKSHSVEEWFCVAKED
jgi:hypothetical protein